MNTILVVDDNAICRELVAESLRGAGYTVRCAETGEEALRLLQQEPPGLILLDMVMPGLDGMAVLRSIRSNRLWRAIPVIFLTDCADRDHIVGVARFHVQGYLLKRNFNREVLLSKVREHLGETVAAVSRATATGAGLKGSVHPPAIEPKSVAAASPPASGSHPVARTVVAKASGSNARSALEALRPLITKKELSVLVNRGLELRPLGVAVQGVIAATSSAACTADDVAKAVSQDQTLAIRILKLANSSAYSRGRGVDSLREAVQRIGISEVRKLVMTLGVIEQYEGSAQGHVDSRLFWEHSTACGLFASGIARVRNIKAADDYFLWGMLHDVGRLIMIEHVPQVYEKVFETAERLDLPLEAIEDKLTLLDHCDVLEQALEHWKFPRPFVTPVVAHHQSLTSIQRLPPAEREPAATIALANRLAHATLMGSSGNGVLYAFDDLVKFLSIQPDSLLKIIEEVRDETRNLKLSLIARSDAKGWPAYAQVLAAQLPVAIRPLHLEPVQVESPAKILLDEIAERSEAPCNIGVAMVRVDFQPHRFVEQLARYEEKHACPPLSLLLLTSDRKTATQTVLVPGRRVSLLQLPVTHATLFRRIQELLHPSNPQ